MIVANVLKTEVVRKRVEVVLPEEGTNKWPRIGLFPEGTGNMRKL